MADPEHLPKPGKAPELSAEEERRQRLKAAGEAYFAKVLHQSKGRDLLAAAKSSAPGASGGGAAAAAPAAAQQRLPLTTFDEDFLQAGAVIEGARTYVLGTVFVAAQAVQLVFMKSALGALRAPAFLLALHYLPVVLLLWLLAGQGLLQLRPPSLRTLQGGAAAAVLGACQALALLWALCHAAVFPVLCWNVAAPHLLRSALELLLSGRRPAGGRVVALSVVLGCTASALLAQSPGLLGLLALLCWTAAEAAAAAWAQLRQRPDLAAAAAAAGGGAALAAQLAEAEAALDCASLAAAAHALPLAPCLLLGLLLGEGRQLVDHDLSVPAVTMILLSCLAMAVAVATGLLISGGLTRQAHAALVAAGPLGTVVTEAAVHGLSSPIALVAAIACSLAGVLLRVTAAAQGT